MPEKYLFLSGGGWALGGANYVGSVSIIQQTLLTTNLGDMDIDITVLYCTVLYCTVLYYIHLDCTAMLVLRRSCREASLRQRTIECGGEVGQPRPTAIDLENTIQ